MRYWSVAVGGFLTLVSLAAEAQQTPGPPDLSGTWLADMKRSSFVGTVAPKGWSVTIEHNGSRLLRTETVTSADGRVSRQTMTFTIDGKENRNRIEADDVTFTTKSSWEGRTLILQGTIKMGPSYSAPWEERLTLSADGSLLTASSEMKHKQGVNQTIFYLQRKGKATPR